MSGRPPGRGKRKASVKDEEIDIMGEGDFKKTASVPSPPFTQTSSPTPIHQPFKNPNFERKYESRKKQWKQLKNIVQGENYNLLPVDVATYSNIEVAPSILPSKKYCDFTGLPAPYRDPKTNLRYSSAHFYPFIRSLSDEHVQSYLALRKANIILK
eukprot:TRINITY_DN908_c0_g1_i1.p1 TRINITY_DN908_c0_g1~~TRINITY_DN908_c0_g1_i1.p1  ORF type:complete len:156 (-),score=24.24 TRINITY_DN908_c0_g1_i1:59-526(-)